MTIREYRAMALSFPEAEEQSHMGHPDFRVGGKIFATLWPADGWGMVKLTPLEQLEFMQADPEAFEQIPGGWGARGATRVWLARVSKRLLRRAMDAAWRNVAPKRLIKESKPK